LIYRTWKNFTNEPGRKWTSTQ
jgi:hypothetical protein